MKRINRNLLIAIVWIVIAGLFFYMHKIGVGVCWLLVGIVNLMRAIKTYQMNKEAQAIAKHLEETVNVKNEEEPDNPQKDVMEVIQLSTEEHLIHDDSYGYFINKTFKPVKSHAAEVELLCTYAPNDVYGEEGKVPYIALQMDDIVYCAIEEYKENKTFDGAMSIEQLEGMFMFKAKCPYYDNMMYFYGIEFESEGYLEKAGLCLVYPKEYIGSEHEENLMTVLDVAAKTFHTYSELNKYDSQIHEKSTSLEEKAVVFLKKEIAGKKRLDELILAFEKMCEIPIDEEEEKEILFETGTYSFSGEPMFYFSLVRQYPNQEEYYQIHLDIMYKPTEKNSLFKQTTWNFELKESIFDYIRRSEEYKALEDECMIKMDVYMDET